SHLLRHQTPPLAWVPSSYAVNNRIIDEADYETVNKVIELRARIARLPAFCVDHVCPQLDAGVWLVDQGRMGASRQDRAGSARRPRSPAAGRVASDGSTVHSIPAGRTTPASRSRGHRPAPASGRDGSRTRLPIRPHAP